MKETFGQKFSKLRKEKGLTQEDIAEKVNISSQAVSKWENDISLPDISVLPILADILDVSIDELLGREKTPIVEVIEEKKRKDINKMLLKIKVDAEGNKVNINIPLAIVKVCLESGLEIPQVSGNVALSSINFEEVFKMIESGVIGEIVSVETDEGARVSIVVE